MLITISICGAVLLLLALYLYTQTEALRRERSQLKQQLAMVTKHRDSRKTTITSLAKAKQEQLRQALNRKKNPSHSDGELAALEALIDASASVIIDSSNKQLDTATVFRKQLSKVSELTIGEFNEFILHQEDTIRTEWHRKNVAGYLTMCDRLIEQLKS